MVESVGAKLRQAREARQLTVDDVANATKIRPERIADLESDEHTHFPSLVYARSFLVKYAKYLGADIREELENFQVGSFTGVGDYHYLASTPPPRYQRSARREEPRRHGLPMLIFGGVAVLVLIGVPVISILAFNISRLNIAPDVVVAAASATPEQSPAPTAEFRTRETALVAADREKASPTAPEQLPLVASGPLPTVSQSQEKPVPTPASTPTIVTSKVLEVRVRERTWLRITKDQENSEPVFNDFVQPNSFPVMLVGRRFWLRASDKSVLEVRKDGKLVNGPQPDIYIE